MIAFGSPVAFAARILMLIVTISPSPATAQGIDAPPSAFAANEGIVRKVDRATGEIVIRHGPLTEVDMPPMTMAFEVKTPALLDKARVGDRVKIRVQLLNGRFTVTQIERRP